MKKWVKCQYCNAVYNLYAVEVIARYADAMVFKSPCCHKEVDDREWKSLSDFEEVTQEYANKQFIAKRRK